MSAENVQLVRTLMPQPEMDLVELFGRGVPDDQAEALLASIAPITDDFVAVVHDGLSHEPRPGIAGLRQSWLDWLSPWESYRVEIDDLVDAGERVLVLSDDYGRRPGMEGEVRLLASAVWTMRDGRVARAEFFTERADAFRAAGLAAPPS